jgi:hypothetical protein
MYMDVDTISGVVLQMWDPEAERQRWSGSRLDGASSTGACRAEGWDRGVDEMMLVLDQ